MPDHSEAPRLFLVAPPVVDPATFANRMAEALSAADIAAVLIGAEVGEETVAKLVEIVQAAGAAALIAEDTRIAGRLKADGVHVGSGLGDLRMAVDSFGGKRIVGAGNLHSRHTAMQAAEFGADYVFFGRPHGDTHDFAHPKALDLVEWWSELMEIPAGAMAGRSLESVAETAATGAAFVALHEAVWSHQAGPGEAIRAAAAALQDTARRAA